MTTDGGAVVRVRPADRGRSLTSRASLNAVASGLEYGARAIVELLVSPLVVAGVGAAAYGAWRVLWQWSSYVWGASGRSAQALQFAIAHKQWTADDAEKRQLVGAAVLVWLLFLPLMLAAGLVGVWLAPVLLDVPSDLVTPLRVAAAILAVDAMAMTLVTLPRSSLVGENLGYTRMGISAGLVAVGGGLLVLAVELDLGLPGLAGATLLTTLLTGAVFAAITRRRLPWFGAARPSRALARWFLGLSVWFLGWKLVLELMVASDVLVLALFVPLSVVAAFALSKWVADAMAQVLSILVQATIPGIGGYLGSGSVDVAARLRGEVMSLVWVVGTGIGTTVLVWNGTFVGLWVGGDLYAGDLTTLLVVVLAFQLALIRTDTFIIDVALRPRVKVVAGGLTAFLSIALAATAAGPLDGGVVGLCLGLVLGRGVLGVVAPLAVGRILGVPPRRQSARVARPALTTAALFAAGYWLAGLNPVSSWFLLVTGVAGTVVTVTGAALFLGLSTHARSRLVRRARALLRREGRTNAEGAT
jgi:O-antigen/teichoic acid export membrane protein